MYTYFTRFSEAIKDSNQSLPVIIVADFKNMPFFRVTLEQIRKLGIYVGSVSDINELNDINLPDEAYIALIVKEPFINKDIIEFNKVRCQIQIRKRN